MRPAILITVDDGYADFVEVALPLLEAYEIPATLFVTTRFVDGDIWLWPDIVNFAIKKTQNASLALASNEAELSLRTNLEKKQATLTLIKACKQLNERAKTEFLTEITAKLRVHIPSTPTHEFRSVSWDDLKRVDGNLIEVGSHTLNHPILSRLSLEQAEREIAESKAAIEEKIGREVTAFAYPNGMLGDYNDEHKELLRKHGYLFAVTCNPGFITMSPDPLELNRMNASYDMPHFVQAVSGFDELKRRLRQRLSLSQTQAG
jgi:peptidoglycan/xylan/chitin deacetylase (PgdA/CDA1 family)